MGEKINMKDIKGNKRDKGMMANTIILCLMSYVLCPVSYVLCFMSCVLMTSCTTPDYLSEKALHEYLADENHGLSKKINAGNVTMKVTYRPADLMVWQELEGERDTSGIREAFAKYDPYCYFMMQLSSGDKDALYGTSLNQADFNEKLQTLSFRMNQFLDLTTSDHDTIPLADAHYARMFSLSKSSDVLLVFNKEQIGNQEWISVNSKEFGFKTGRRSFRFRVEDLQRAPKLTELKPYYTLYDN